MKRTFNSILTCPIDIRETYNVDVGNPRVALRNRLSCEIHFSETNTVEKHVVSRISFILNNY